MKKRFATRLALLAILLAIAPVIAIGWILVDVNQDTLRRDNEELMLAITDDIANAATGSLDETRARLAAVAIVLGDATRTPADRLAVARAVVAASGLEAVAVFDERGAKVDAIVTEKHPWRGPATLTDEDRDAATRTGSAVGAVAFAGGDTHALLVVPIAGQSARWFAATQISLAPLADRLVGIARDRFAGRFDAVTLIDRTLRYVVHADPERLGTPATDLALLDGVDAGTLAAGILVYRDVGGTVGVIRSLPSLPWAVVAQAPRDVVYRSSERARRFVIVAIATAALLAILAALLLARRVAAPIRLLVTLAQDLGKRRFDRRVEIKTGDELETLGDAMHAAATDLQAGELRLREEEATRAQLGRYLPQALVDRVAKRDLALAGRRREITVVFADIAAFTALAEREPPDKVVTLLNQLFTILTEIVFRHGGTVDKLIGDCLMAFWGAPDDQPDHAQRAVAAAVDMQRWLEVANDCWEQQLGLTIHLAIGVHTGDAIVGNLGSEARMEYTCVGDTVNVAARLETLARPQQILISETTRAALGERPRCAALGRRHLPGRMAPVELHEVIL
jgi:adenylate cyclase